jgi:hypothetical protein
MIAVADAHSAGMKPGPGGQEEKAQARRSQRVVLHGFLRNFFFIATVPY